LIDPVSRYPMTTEDQNKTMQGEGPQDAAVMLVGQNPGRQEVASGRPFVGRAGQYLNQVLQHHGIDRGRLYLTAVVKAGTPRNRKPTAREIDRWMPLLMDEIRTINPRIILLMGQIAWKTPRVEGIDYMETYHPAAAMRFPRIRHRFEKDMARLRDKMKEHGLKGIV
jgi:uracil-DNA glycosylase